MAKFERIALHIETSNAAFEESPTSEIARILRKLADDFENGNINSWHLIDINGNNVGEMSIQTCDDEED
jgi:hypothetical protein